jgi:succinate dehydrogenase / fumarate reductase, cytochrome b subunit
MRGTLLRSSTAAKALVALTGLSLVAFLVLHLAGNLLVFAGPRTFNAYSDKLIRNPLVYPLEIGLAAIFLLHAYRALRGLLAGRHARPERYHHVRWAGKPSRRSTASWTMAWTGLWMLLFVAVHLKGLKWGAHYTVPGSEVRDLYRTQMEHLGQPLVALFYLVSMVLIGMHLWHGAWSAFQSLGLGDRRWTPRLVRAGKTAAALLAGGFIFVALWVAAWGAPAYLRGLP